MTFVSVIVQGAGVGIAVEQISTVSYFLIKVMPEKYIHKVTNVFRKNATKLVYQLAAWLNSIYFDSKPNNITIFELNHHFPRSPTYYPQLKDGVNRTFYEMVKNYADYNFEENSTVPIDYMQSTVSVA